MPTRLDAANHKRETCVYAMNTQRGGGKIYRNVNRTRQ